MAGTRPARTPVNLDALTDVATGDNPTTGQALVYSSVTGTWAPGTPSLATVASTVTAVAAASPAVLVGDTVIGIGAGVPVDGTTLDEVAGKGSLYIDITNGVLYINTGTKSSSTWTKVGTQS